MFASVLGLVTKNIEQLCEERNCSSHLLPFFRDQKPETTVYIDKTEKQVISRSYDFANWFSEGSAAIEIDGKWGFIDKTGNFVIRPQFKAAGSFRGGLAGVEGFDGKVGYINKLGRYVWGPMSRD